MKKIDIKNRMEERVRSTEWTDSNTWNVLDRIRKTKETPRFRWSPALLPAAAVLVLVVCLGAVSLFGHRGSPDQIRNNLQTLQPVSVSLSQGSGQEGEGTVSPDTVLYYNPDGGRKYHLDPACKSVHEKYIPLQGHFTFAEVNDAKYSGLEPCVICGAPARDVAKDDAADSTEGATSEELSHNEPSYIKAYPTPLNLVCEDQGIRMELISAVVEGKKSCITCSLQDLEGDRINESTVGELNESDNLGGIYCVGHPLTEYNPAEHKITYTRDVTYLQPVSRTEDDMFTLSLDHIATYEAETIDLLPLLKEYGKTVEGVRPPEGTLLYGGNPLPDDLRVLDYNNPLNIPLNARGNIILTGIGWIGDQLHVQTLRTADYPLSDQFSWVRQVRQDPSDDFPASAILLNSWYMDRPGMRGTVDEFLYDIKTENTIPESLTAEIMNITSSVYGNWEFRVPLSSVMANAGDTASESVPAADDVSPDTVLYYNPDGGTRYHLDPACKSVHEKYIPLQGHFTFAEVNDAKYSGLEPCVICGAPARDAAKDGRDITENVLPSEDDILSGLVADIKDPAVPLNLTCEKNGIRFELISGAVTGSQMRFTCSLQDLEGDRVREYLGASFTPSLSVGDPSVTGFSYTCLDYDEAAHKGTYEYILNMDPDFDTTDRNLTVGIENLFVTEGAKVDLIPLLKQYGTESEGTDAPDGSWPLNSDEESPDLQDIKVLDTGRALNVPLYGNVSLDNIGWIGNQLHVRLRTSDINMLNGERQEFYTWSANMWNYPLADKYNSSLYTDCWPLFWPETGTYTRTEEFISKATPDDVDHMELTAIVENVTEVVDGPWEVQVPLSVICENAAAAPEAGETSGSLDSLREIYPGLASEMIPVYDSCEDQGIRLEVLGAMVRGNNSYVLCTLQDLEGERINESTVGGQYSDRDNLGTIKMYGHNPVTYDPENHKLTYLINKEYREMETPTDDIYKLSMDTLSTLTKESRDLAPMLKQYGKSVQGVRPPEDFKVLYGEDSLPEDPKVLDWHNPQNVLLNGRGNILLTGIGWIGDQLHVQTLATGKSRSDSYSYIYSLFCESHDGSRYPASQVYWEIDEAGLQGHMEEYIFSTGTDNPNQLKLSAEIINYTSRVEGAWEVQFPLSAVTVEGHNLGDFEEVEDLLKPLNLTAEKQGFRMELLSAFAEEDTLWLTYSLQDLEGGHVLDTINSPDLACSAVPVTAANTVTSHDDNQEERKILYKTCIQYYGQFPAENQFTSITFDFEPAVKEKINFSFSFMLDDIRTATAGNAAVTVPESDPSAAAYAKIIDSNLKERYPDITDKLQPVNLSREDQGIRLDVHYVASDEDANYIVYSLLDLEADSRDGKLDSSTAFKYITCADVAGNAYSYAELISTICTNAYSGQTTYLRKIRHRFDPSESVPADARLASINLNFVPVSKGTNIDVLPQVKEYAAAVDGVESPKLLPDSMFSDETNYWKSIPDEKTTVLDYTRPLDLTLYKTISLTGAGWIDGKLHVQAHNKDEQLLDGSDHHRVELSQHAYCYAPYGKSNDGHIYWDDNGDRYAEWYELTFDVSPEELDQSTSLTLYITEYTDILHGDWTIELPRIQSAEEPAPAAQESNEASAPDFSTPEGRYAVIRDRLQPLNNSMDYDGVRIELISGYLEENNLWVVYSVQYPENITGLDLTQTPEIWRTARPDFYESMLTLDPVCDESGRKVTYVSCLTYPESFGDENREVEFCLDLQPVMKDQIDTGFGLEFMLDDVRPEADRTSSRLTLEEAERNFRDTYFYHDIGENLKPVNLVCEDREIRLEVISGLMKNGQAWLLCSLQDLEGSWVDESALDYFDDYVNLGEESHYSHCFLGYSKAEHKLYYLREADCNMSDLGPGNMLTYGIMSFSRQENKDVDLIPLLNQYGITAEGVRPPDDASFLFQPYLTDPDSSNIRILDSSSPLNIPLNDNGNALLSAIGWIDGQLHVQVYNDSEAGKDPECSETFTGISSVNGFTQADPYEVYWNGCWSEYILDAEPGYTGNPELTGCLSRIADQLDGSWEIRIPAESIMAK